MARWVKDEQLTVRQTLQAMTVPHIKQIVALSGRADGTRKEVLIEQLATILGHPKSVRDIYNRLDDISQKAIQEATHHPRGFLDNGQFEAKFGSRVVWGEGKSYHKKPTPIRLLFPREGVLPTDVRAILQSFVPAPASLELTGLDILPDRAPRPHLPMRSKYHSPNPEEVELRIRPTESDAIADLKTILRLIEAGEVKVGETTRRASNATMDKIRTVLTEGDFYREDECEKDAWEPSHDLTMKPFAWPLLIQAAGLATTTGSKLQLTPAGRIALTKPAHQVIDQIWSRWSKNKLLDEFNRIDVIKGKNARSGLTAVEPRRQVIVDGLCGCPPGQWVSIGAFFRYLKASQSQFEIARDPWTLYLWDQESGSFGYTAQYTWETLQGRYTLAFLFEYAATLGLIDVAYISPIGARNDFRDRSGTDDFSSLSRYDGLAFFRVNALGAFCLGLAPTYEPPVPVVERTLRVLPNLDVVAIDRAPPKADALFLERIAEHKSEVVWQLSREKILAAVESGMVFGEVREFLASRIEGELPQTAEVFLSDLGKKADQLEDLGDARIIGCKDSMVALTIVSDRRLKSICQLAGDRQIVFKASDEAAIRKVLRGMGYVLPLR